MQIKDLYQYYVRCNKICTDTRKIEKGDLFFALKGDTFDANQFTQEALEKGALAVVIDNPAYFTGKQTILVDDALQALQNLANHHRKILGIPIISLTGSNGKTTTKELINNVLSKKFKTIATVGNLNNHIGVPLTLLSMDKSTQIGIVEMGANHQKEIAFLCQIAEPDYGYITNFGKAHLEGFGGIEGVIKGKSELYIDLFKRNGFVFFNADDPIQAEKLKDYPNKKSFGSQDNAGVKVEFVSADPFVTIRVWETIICSKLIGAYNLNNIAASVLIGLHFKIPLPKIKEAIEAYVPLNNRSQIIEKNGKRIVLDAYNANPSSMKVALENFAYLSGEGKLAILGDMFELGNEAAQEHQNIVELAEKLEVNTLLVGTNFCKTNSRFKKFNTFEDLKAYLQQNPLNEKTMLIKASRGMALERLLEYL